MCALRSASSAVVIWGDAAIPAAVETVRICETTVREARRPAPRRKPRRESLGV